MAQPYFPIHHKDLPQKVTIALQNPTVLWDRNDKHPLISFYSHWLPSGHQLTAITSCSFGHLDLALSLDPQCTFKYFC
jgi:hypothetical protein